LTGRRRTILAAIHSLEDLPAHVRDLVPALVEGRVGAVAMLTDALANAEATRQKELQDAQGAVDRSQTDKQARVAAVAAAEAQLAGLAQAVSNRRCSVKEAAKATEAAEATLQSATAARKSAEADLKALVGRKSILEKTEKKAYLPLKAAPAGGQTGQKRLKNLCKVGLDFGFHEVLISSLPGILGKHPDKRRTFDSLAMEQLEVEFTRRAGSLDAEREACEAALEERAGALLAARDALAASKEQQRRESAALAGSEASLEEGKGSLKAARLHARAFAGEARERLQRLTRARADINAFRRGPLAALAELKASLPPMSAEAHAAATADEVGAPLTPDVDMPEVTLAAAEAAASPAPAPHSPLESSSPTKAASESPQGSEADAASVATMLMADRAPAAS